MYQTPPSCTQFTAALLLLECIALQVVLGPLGCSSSRRRRRFHQQLLKRMARGRRAGSARSVLQYTPLLAGAPLVATDGSLRRMSPLAAR
jgi:hypothetical protein